VERDGDLAATIDFPYQGRMGLPVEISSEPGLLLLRTPEPDGSAERILELEIHGELATGHYGQPDRTDSGQAAFLRVVETEAAALRLLPGEYRTASGAGFRVEILSRATDRVLAVTFRDAPGSRTMFPVSPMEFVVGTELEAPVPVEARLTFRVGDAGRVTEVEWREAGADSRTARPVPLAVDERRIATFVESVRAEMEVPSFSLGIVSGEELIYARSFGVMDRESGEPATPETLYQIASVTKTFTATLLAILRDEGVLGLDDPVARHLPEGLPVPGADGAPEITLRHLLTHSSGLPLQPVNYALGDRYHNDYSAEMLHEGLAGTGLLFPPDSSWSYSNLGYILLADVLARATGNSFEELLEDRLLEPLGMHDTTIDLDADELDRLATHYWSDAPYEASPYWRPGPIAGHGGLTSSVRDIARYLSFQFRENLVDAGPLSGATLREIHRPQRQRFDPRRWVGHAWFVLYSPDAGEILSHSGFTGGHSSYVAFSPGLGIGVVVLANFGREPTDRVGRWLLHQVVTAAREQQTATPLAARRFFFKGDWANAAWAYRGVAARDPGNGEAAYRLGASLFQIRRLEEAANAWSRAAASGYDPARSLYKKGSALAVMGRRDEAVAALRHALDAGLENLERIDSDADWRGLAGYPPFEALRSGSITPR